MQTTLNKIRAHGPCYTGWVKLLKHLGKTQSDDEPLSILTVLGSNGLDDAIWCLRAVEGHDREIRLFAVWCARQVQHLMKDERSITALDVAERFANGLATSEELSAARNDAWDAALDASREADLDEHEAFYARSAAQEATCVAPHSALVVFSSRAAARANELAARNKEWKVWNAEWDATRAAQEKELRRILG